MLNIPQIEALRRSNPQLYEALKRLSEASLGPNQGWSLDNQITDGTNYARVVSGALTAGKIDPTKTGVLMKGSVPPTWSGGFTYVSTMSSITWSWSGLSIYRADGTSTAVPNGSFAVTGLTAGTTYYFYPYWDDTLNSWAWVLGGTGTPAGAQLAKTNLAAQIIVPKETWFLVEGNIEGLAEGQIAHLEIKSSRAYLDGRELPLKQIVWVP